MANLGQMFRQLRRERASAQHLVERLDEAIAAFEKLVGTNSRGATRNQSNNGRRRSAAARRRMSRAQKARWAKRGNRELRSVDLPRREREEL
jgi:hypothetical protein